MGNTKDKISRIRIVRFLKWLRDAIIWIFMAPEEPPKPQSTLYQQIDPTKDININDYLKERVQDQITHFDNKAVESQQWYHRYQKIIIICSAFSAFIISLNCNGLFSLVSSSEERAEEERIKLYENYKECYTIFQDNIKKQTDSAALKLLPNPKEIADKEWDTLIVYYKKCYKTCNVIQKENKGDSTDFNKLPNPTTQTKYEKSKFRDFIRNLDLEKGIVTLCSFLIVIVTGFDKLMKHYEKWHRNRENCEKLKREVYSYHYDVGVYQKVNKDKDKYKKNALFVERVETIINDYIHDMLSEKNGLTIEQIKELIKQETAPNGDAN